MTEERLKHIIRAVHDHFEAGVPLNKEELEALERMCDRQLHLGHSIRALERCYKLVLALRVDEVSKDHLYEILQLREILYRILTVHGRRVPEPKRARNPR